MARSLLLALLALPAACGTEAPRNGRVLVFAAASLRDVGAALEALYERECDVDVEFVYAGSNLLANQLSAGARADLFLAAGPAPMQRVQQAGLLLEGSRVDWLSNQLVVVRHVARGHGQPSIPDAEGSDPRALFATGAGRVAVARPGAVPAGTYAREWLAALGIWDGLGERLTPARDVRAALALVESGAAELGIVYATDVGARWRARAGSRRVRVVHRVAPELGPAVVYPLAVLAEASDVEAARAFAGFLRGRGAAEVVRREGFLSVGKRGSED